MYEYHIPTNTWKKKRDDIACGPAVTGSNNPKTLKSRSSHSMLFHPVSASYKTKETNAVEDTTFKVLKKYIYKVELISCLTFRNSENYSFLVGNEKETNT